MKKWFLIISISAVILVFASAVFAAGSEMFEKILCNIRVGNSVAELQYPIYISDNRIYVSLRSICDELGIPIEWNEEKNEAEMDIYNKKVTVSDKTQLKEEGVIPDEETALIVGKAILEKYAGKSLEYETEDKIYYLEVEFLEQYNAWRLYQTFKYKNGGGWAASGVYLPCIKLNKNTGEVMYINTYSTFKD